MRVDPEADSKWAFDAYQQVRERLPQAGGETRPMMVDSLADLADQFDVFLLDAYGVLNIGEQAIPGTCNRIADLQAAGKRVMVVTNSAGYPKRLLMKRYERLGYTFAAADIVSSRETLLAGLQRETPRQWGLMAAAGYGTEELEELDITFLQNDPKDYAAAESFILLGTGDWTDAQQTLLEETLRQNPRPVFVGNPDIVAPVEGGLSKQPGHYAHSLADTTGCTPAFFGKPFANIYELVFRRLPTNINRNRVVMVGDTLHTDILGGQVAGVKTALVTDYGSLKGFDIASAIATSGISPDFILPRP